MNNANVFLSGAILLFLFICQLYKVYKADAEYKKDLARYLKTRKETRRNR